MPAGTTKVDVVALELKANSKGLDKATKAFEKATKSLDKLVKSFNKIAKSQEKMAKSMEMAAKSMKASIAAQAKLSKSVSVTATKINKTTSATRRSAAATKKSATATKDAAISDSKKQKISEQLTRTYEAQALKLRGLTRAGNVNAAGSLGGLTRSHKAAMTRLGAKDVTAQEFAPYRERFEATSIKVQRKHFQDLSAVASVDSAKTSKGTDKQLMALKSVIRANREHLSVMRRLGKTDTEVSTKNAALRKSFIVLGRSVKTGSLSTEQFNKKLTVLKSQLQGTKKLSKGALSKQALTVGGKKGGKSAAQETEKQLHALKMLRRARVEDIGSLHKLGATNSNVKKQLDSVRRSYRQLTVDVKKGTLSSAEFKKRKDDLTASFRRLTRQNRMTIQSIKKLTHIERESAAAAKATANAHDRFKQSSQRMAKYAQIAFGPLSGIAARITAIAALANTGTIALALFAGAFIGVLGVLYKSIQAYTEYEKQIVLIRKQLRHLGSTSTLTAAKVDLLAKAIGEATLTSAAKVREAASIFIGFGVVSEEVLGRALVAAQNLAAVLGKDIVSESRKLARALAFPSQNITTLTESLIQTTRREKLGLRFLEKSGQLKKAQSIVLDLIDGVAKGAGTLSGISAQLDAVGERVRRIAESVGEFASKGVTGALEGFLGTLERIGPDIEKVNAKIAQLYPGSAAISANKKFQQHINYTIVGTKKLTALLTSQKHLEEGLVRTRAKAAKVKGTTGVRGDSYANLIFQVSYLERELTRTNKQILTLTDNIDSKLYAALQKVTEYSQSGTIFHLPKQQAAEVRFVVDGLTEMALGIDKVSDASQSMILPGAEGSLKRALAETEKLRKEYDLIARRNIEMAMGVHMPDSAVAQAHADNEKARAGFDRSEKVIRRNIRIVELLQAKMTPLMTIMGDTVKEAEELGRANTRLFSGWSRGAVDAKQQTEKLAKSLIDINEISLFGDSTTAAFFKDLRNNLDLEQLEMGTSETSHTILQIVEALGKIIKKSQDFSIVQRAFTDTRNAGQKLNMALQELNETHHTTAEESEFLQKKAEMLKDNFYGLDGTIRANTERLKSLQAAVANGTDRIEDYHRAVADLQKGYVTGPITRQDKAQKDYNKTMKEAIALAKDMRDSQFQDQHITDFFLQKSKKAGINQLREDLSSYFPNDAIAQIKLASKEFEDLKVKALGASGAEKQVYEEAAKGFQQKSLDQFLGKGKAIMPFEEYTKQLEAANLAAEKFGASQSQLKSHMTVLNNTVIDTLIPGFRSLEDGIVDVALNSENALVNLGNVAMRVAQDIFKDLARAAVWNPLRNWGMAAVNTALGIGGGGGAHPAAQAKGGLMTGPGTGTSDSIPAWLSNREFVMNAKATKMWLPVLERMNNFKMAKGGMVGSMPMSSGSNMGMGGMNYNPSYNLNVTVEGSVENSRDLEARMQGALKTFRAQTKKDTVEIIGGQLRNGGMLSRDARI